jgi:hypothetical protein
MKITQITFHIETDNGAVCDGAIDPDLVNIMPEPGAFIGNEIAAYLAGLVAGPVGSMPEADE